jgi:hypothetical protein
MRTRLAFCLAGLALAAAGCGRAGADRVIVGAADADAGGVAAQVCALHDRRARPVGVAVPSGADGFLSAASEAVFVCERAPTGAPAGP